MWPIQNEAKNLKINETQWHVGTHLRVLSKSYPMNINMTAFRCFSKVFASLGVYKSSLNPYAGGG